MGFSFIFFIKEVSRLLAIDKICYKNQSSVYLQQPEFIIILLFFKNLDKLIILKSSMPKVQFEYQGKIHSFEFEFNQTTKLNVQQQIKNLWGLNFEQIVLDYTDSDGDQICVDTQEDFDVAQETAGPNSQNLTFRAIINPGFTPTFIQISQPKLEQIKNQQKPNTQETVAAPQSQINIVEPQVQIKQIQIKVQAQASQNANELNTAVQEQKIAQNIENEKKLKKELELKKKLQQEEKKKIQAQERAEAKQKMRIEAEQKRKELELLQEEKRKAKQQARLKKQQEKREDQQRKLAEKKKAQQAKKLQKVKVQEHKEEEIKKQQKQISSQSSDKSVQKVKQVKKQEALTEERVKVLVREQILSMIPQLKKQILSPQKQEKPAKKLEISSLVQQREENLCSTCLSQLHVPFFFNPDTKKYECNECEAKRKQMTPMLKIKDPEHFKNSYYTYAGTLNMNEIVESPENWQKYIEEARVKVVTRIKQDFKVKVQQKKKQLKQKEAAKKQKQGQ